MKKLIILSLFILATFCALAQKPLYRYYNAKQQRHYFTLDFNEFGNGAKGWVLEGVACKVYIPNAPGADAQNVFRFYNPQTGDHYYTAGRNVSRQDLIGYKPEGAVFTDFRRRVPGTYPLLEYYNPNTADHFYTIDKNELGRGFEGYHFVMIVGFVYPR